MTTPRPKQSSPARQAPVGSLRLSRSRWASRPVGWLQRTTRSRGIDVRRYREFPVDFDTHIQAIHQRVAEYTLVSPERTSALVSSIEYLERCHIAGDIVECGVWKGGSMMAAALAVDRVGGVDRDLWLYDTFMGLTQPGEMDVDVAGNSALQQMRERHPNLLPGQVDGSDVFAFASLDEVRNNMATVGYRGGQVRFVKGSVQDTIPASIPDRIALLRLDTDFYDSTKHELTHLVPRMVPGGILIIDDYGAWLGARQAVDEFLDASGTPMYLHRVDTTARLAVVGTPVGIGAGRRHGRVQ